MRLKISSAPDLQCSRRFQSQQQMHHFSPQNVRNDLPVGYGSLWVNVFGFLFQNLLNIRNEAFPMIWWNEPPFCFSRQFGKNLYSERFQHSSCWATCVFSSFLWSLPEALLITEKLFAIAMESSVTLQLPRTRLRWLIPRVRISAGRIDIPDPQHPDSLTPDVNTVSVSSRWRRNQCLACLHCGRNWIHPMDGHFTVAVPWCADPLSALRDRKQSIDGHTFTCGPTKDRCWKASCDNNCSLRYIYMLHKLNLTWLQNDTTFSLEHGRV